MSTTTDYGEPWREIVTWDQLITRDGKVIIYDASQMNEPYRSRAVECVSACRGIDPEAALQKARDEFAHLIRLVEPFLEAGNAIPGLATMNGAKLALSLLTPSK